MVLSAGTAFSGTDIDVETAYRLSKAGKVVLVDVRTPGEWGRNTGFPKGAMTITLHDPKGPQGFADAVAKAVEGKRDTPLAVICASGNRSLRAQQILLKAGFSKVHNVRGGVLGRDGAKGWFGLGLPVEHCVKCQNSVSIKREYVQ